MTFELAIISAAYVVLEVAAYFVVSAWLDGVYMRRLTRECEVQRKLDQLQDEITEDY